jgi:diacylglycerol kinase family enzyme
LTTDKKASADKACLVKVKSEAEMGQIANAIDTKEADCLFLVGGDGTICRVLSAICRDGSYEQKLPIGLFPGGQRNLTFRALDFVPEIKSLFK